MIIVNYLWIFPKVFGTLILFIYSPKLVTFQGYQEAREAVAEYSSNEFLKVDPKVCIEECRKRISEF